MPENKGFVKPANPKRVAHEQAKQRAEGRKTAGKPTKVTNEEIYDMLTDVQQTQIYLVELLQQRN